MPHWFIIDQLEEPFPGDEILGFWFEDGFPTMGVLVYQPTWFVDGVFDSSNDGPYGWNLPGLFGIMRADGSWIEEPQEIHPTHWMPLPDPPIKPRTIRPFIEDLIGKAREQ